WAAALGSGPRERGPGPVAPRHRVARHVLPVGRLAPGLRPRGRLADRPRGGLAPAVGDSGFEETLGRGGRPFDVSDLIGTPREIRRGRAEGPLRRPSWPFRRRAR